MNISEIELLVDLVESSTVSEVSVRNGDRRVSIRRGAVQKRESSSAVAVRPADTTIASAKPAQAAKQPAAATTNLVIHAPIVGIFRHAEPPIGLGTKVAKGQVVGAIESMKLMNDVRSNVEGTVTEIDVEGGMAVEFGQPLFILGPTNEG